MILRNEYEFLPISRLDSRFGRKYRTVCGDLPSVTTILSKCKSEEDKASLDRWRLSVGEDEAKRILKESSDIGTLIHKHLECVITDTPRPSGNNLIHKQGKRFSDVIITNGFKNISHFVGCEVPLFYPYLYAGTCDAIGYYNGKLAIIDFKNSRGIKKTEHIKSYYHQLAAYVLAFNTLYNENIDKAVIMMVVRGDKNKDDSGKYLEWILEGEELKQAQDEWIEMVTRFYEMEETVK